MLIYLPKTELYFDVVALVMTGISELYAIFALSELNRKMGKVLIIDDEKQILSLLSRIIGLEGYDVYQAASGKAGIRQLEQNDPEVIRCDVCLPDGSGVELVTVLKRLRPLSEVILLTAHGNIPDGVQAIKNGAFDYITKGDDNNKILPLIAKAMETAPAASRLPLS